MFSLFLDFIASEKFENMFDDSKAFNLIKSPEEMMLEYFRKQFQLPLKILFSPYPLGHLNLFQLDCYLLRHTEFLFSKIWHTFVSCPVFLPNILLKRKIINPAIIPSKLYLNIQNYYS